MVQESNSLYLSSISNNNEDDDDDESYKFFKDIACSNENYTIDLS